jgi:hypothetical protein
MPIPTIPFIAYCLVNGITALFNETVTGGAVVVQAGAIVISLGLTITLYLCLDLITDNQTLRDYIAKNKPPTEDKHE